MNATAADAASLLALLEEPDPALVCEALKALDALVPQAWPEMSDSLELLTKFVEQPEFAGSQLAASVVSKIYFHMNQQEKALDYALFAGEYFNPIERTPETDIAYSECMLRNCIDYYVKVRCESFEASSRPAEKKQSMLFPELSAVAGTVNKLDPRLITIVETLISDSVRAKDFSLALGLAVDSRRFDLVERIVNDDLAQSDAALECCRHLALDEVARDALLPRSVKMELLRILVAAYRKKHEASVAAGNETTEYVLQLVNCLTILGDFSAVAALLRELIGSSTDCNNTKVLTAFQIAFDLCSTAPQSFMNSLIAIVSGGAEPEEGSVMKKLLSILSGDLQVDKEQDFLFSHNHTDMYLLNTIKASVGKEDSIKHVAVVYANALMHAGTAVDEFVRKNLEFLGRANYWAKFATTAGFGVIHKGRHRVSRNILARYLPPSNGRAGRDSSEYNQGGALYALGFIHANHGSDIVDYLMETISDPNDSEIKLHGGCLGLGIAAMGTDNNTYYEKLKDIMYTQQGGCVAGEAAGIAMGLVHMGTMTPHIEEMLAYARQTTHERVCRGLVLGIAIAMLGRQEEADVMIEQLITDKNPIVRYGGAFAVALAYCGTGQTKATRKLLHIAVTDVNDDVRRAALTGLGFILFKHPHQVPSLVKLLVDSFNPHVRYGAAMAIGIACAGTALQSAIDLLEPLTHDTEEFVCQGALIAMGLVLVETNKTEVPILEEFNKRCLEIVNKRSPVLHTIGAILALGLVNAGGRNVTISCASLNGTTNMRAVVGLMMFCQYWFWQPYIFFASLAMTPTAVIALNSDLAAVPLRFVSHVAPSQFAYPEGMKPPEKVAKEKGPTAVLSYGHGKASKSKPAAPAAAAAAAATTTIEQKEKKEESEETPKKIVKPKEPSSETLSAPCRVTIRQRKYLSFDVDQSYTPVKTGVIHGITIVRDNKPSETSQDDVVVAPQPFDLPQ